MHREEYIHSLYGKDEPGRTAVHRSYFAQYVNDAVKGLVLRYIGLEVVRRSKDPHLNDIPLHRWDLLVRKLPRVVVDQLKANGDFLSLGTGVCILKEAARLLVEAGGEN